jgi:hypothetical protein
LHCAVVALTGKYQTWCRCSFQCDVILLLLLLLLSLLMQDAHA